MNHPFEQEWASLDAAYDTYRTEAESRVRGSAWVPEPALWGRPQPFFRERLGMTKAPAPLPGPPESPRQVEYYGVDAAGAVVVARQFNAYGDPTEEFFFERDGRRRSVQYRRDVSHVQPLALAEEVREGDRLVEYRTYRGPGLWDVERYGYDGDARLASIEHELRPFPSAEPEHERFELLYDGDVVSEILDADGDVVYRRKELPLKPLLKRAEEELVAAIALAAGRLAQEEPLEGLLIGYSYAAPLRPIVAAVPHPNRALKSWNPWDQRRHLLVADVAPALVLSTREAERGLRQVDDDDVLRGVMIRVARRLQKNQDWEPAPEPGFFVLPVDDDMVDLERNVGDVLPRSMRRAFLDRLP